MASFRSDSTPKTNVHLDSGHARRGRDNLRGFSQSASSRTSALANEGTRLAARMICRRDWADDGIDCRRAPRHVHGPSRPRARGVRSGRAGRLAQAPIHERGPALPAAAAARLRRSPARPQAPEKLTGSRRPHLRRTRGVTLTRTGAGRHTRVGRANRRVRLTSRGVDMTDARGGTQSLSRSTSRSGRPRSRQLQPSSRARVNASTRSVRCRLCCSRNAGSRGSILRAGRSVCS